MTSKLLYVFALLGVAIVLGAAGCQQQNTKSNAGIIDDENGEAMQQPDGGAAQGEGIISGSAGDGMMSDGEAKTFTVEGQNFAYSPNTITVNKGDKVKIIFKNTGGTHDWVLDEFNVRTPIIQTGQTAEVTFTADKAGTFEYYCSIGSHRAMGMVGTLTVQ
jgi:plastocyanin